MIRIILGGQFRGDESAWYSLFRLFSNRNDHVAVYAGGPTVWENFTVPHKFVTTTLDQSSIFHQSTHCHNTRYIAQWSSLYNTYETFKHEFSDTDIVVKARNDLYVYGIFEEVVNENTIYVPEKEFHMKTPFDIETVCNDQIVIGNKLTMDKYFQLPRLYDWNQNYDISIEEVLRNYLRQQNIDIQTFPLEYGKTL